MSSASIPTWVAAAIAIAAVGATSACGGSQTQAAAPSSAEQTTPKKVEEVASEPEAKLPGACVDPVVDGDNHDGMRPFDKHVQDDNDFTGDLDDDGHADQAVEPAWSCGETCNHSLYVMAKGKGCGHYVGTIGTRHRYDLLDDKHHGLHDIAAYPTSYDADDTKHCWEVRWQFDGTTYERVKKRECDCNMTATTKRCSPDWEELK